MFRIIIIFSAQEFQRFLDLFVVVFKGALEEGLGTGADHKVLKSRIYIFAEAIE